MIVNPKSHSTKGPLATLIPDDQSDMSHVELCKLFVPLYLFSIT